MLKVEQYGGSKVETQITRAPMASDNVPAMAFSGNQVAALADTAGTAYKQYQTIQKKISDTEAEQAVTLFERDKNALFFDPKNGYFNTVGQDSLNQAPEVNKKLDELKRTYGDSLKTADGKQSFSRVADRHITAAQQDIMQHSAKGLKAWEVSTAEAQVTNSIENAALYWNDEKKLSVQREMGRQSVQDKALRRSDGSLAATNEELQNYESSFTSMAVQAAMQKSSTEATALLEKYKPSLEGPELVKLQQQIEAKQKTEQIKSEADQAVIQSNSLVAQFSGRDDARSALMEEVNKITDPKLRNSVMKESMYQLNMVKQAETEQTAKIFDDALKFTGGGGTIEQYKSNNPSGWQKMSAVQQQALAAGKGVVNDYDTYFKLVSQPLDRLAMVNPSEYAGQLDSAHREKLTTAVLAARKGQADGMTTRDQQKKDRISELTGIRNPKAGNETIKFNAMNRTVDAMLESKMKETGKSFLSDDEYRKVLSDFSRSVVTPGNLWGTNDVRLKDLPQDEIDAYSAFLKKNGKLVTTENLLKFKNNATAREAALKETK